MSKPKSPPGFQTAKGRAVKAIREANAEITAVQVGPAPADNPNANWYNDAIQFPRLIAELEAVGAFKLTVMKDLREAMDLSTREICEIVDRAQCEWEAIKARL